MSEKENKPWKLYDMSAPHLAKNVEVGSTHEPEMKRWEPDDLSVKRLLKNMEKQGEQHAKQMIAEAQKAQQIEVRGTRQTEALEQIVVELQSIGTTLCNLLILMRMRG